MKLRLRIDEVRGTFDAANAKRSWGERECLRVSLADDEGHTGEGEASPLPGYSPDSLAEARAALETLDGFDADPERPLAALPELDASAGFAAEVALLDWASRRAGRPFASQLPEPARSELPVAALVRSETEGRARLAEGFAVLKLKIGADLDAELALARSLRAAGAVLRFDANGTLPRDQLEGALGALARLDAELLEEPSAGPWPSSPFPLAIDESLVADPETALARLRAGEAEWAVIKPMCVGGIRAVSRLAGSVRGAGGRVLFSHTFGGPIERAAVGALALAFGQGAQGLAPHAGLKVWPAATDLAFDGATLRPNTQPGLGLRWESPW